MDAYQGSAVGQALVEEVVGQVLVGQDDGMVLVGQAVGQILVGQAGHVVPLTGRAVVSVRGKSEAGVSEDPSGEAEIVDC